MKSMRELLKISQERLEEVNALLTDPENTVINQLLEIIERYGGPEEINRKAAEARRFENIMARLEEIRSPYLDDVRWLMEQRDKGAFVSLNDYRRRVLDDRAQSTAINEKNAVTLEISALQFFPWLIAEAKQAIAKQELMPGRVIRVRGMKEQTADNGDTLAVAAAMQVIGATYVETLDTKGTDGSNIHLGGPDTITGYFGGIGQPNDYPLKWADEYLHYFTAYGIRQVLNINSGTVLAGYLMHKLGIDNEFKISVYVGNDNPLAILWTLMTARLFARKSGSTSLIGFNLSNSVNNETIRQAAYIRRVLGLEDTVRFEHHITETKKSIVIQPYLRRDELVEIAKEVPNISAKHEGGDPDVEMEREHPSDILEYFLSKEDILKRGLMPQLERNFLDKHQALNRTADALTRAGIGVICARNLHK
jgi:bifunctional DNA-binding transcriptional regulator/antitoxin component of YhaV-PrlF toxin-antitoxin module